MGWGRTTMAAAVCAAASVLALAPTAAAGYRAADEVTVSKQKVAAGDDLTISLTCDKGGQKASLWYSPKGSTKKQGEATVDTDADGKASATVTVPAKTKPGSYSLSLRCGGTDIVKTGFTVTEADDEPPPDKPETSVSPGTVAAGDAITISGTCAKDTQDAAVWYRLADGSTSVLAEKGGLAADKKGKVSASLVVADDTEPGSYEAVVQCSDDAKPRTAGFTVSQGGTDAGGGATAEHNGTLLALIGGGMLAFGAIGGAIYLQRRTGVAA